MRQRPATKIKAGLRAHLFGWVVAAACGTAMLCRGAVPGPDRLLPEDTLVMVTAPNFVRFREALAKFPLVRCWNDPSMKAFRDKVLAKWNDEVVQPFEQQAGIKLGDYTRLLQGQVTFALVQNGWQGGDNQGPGLVLLVDSRNQSSELAKALAEVRKKWVASGKRLRTEKIRDVEFTILPLSTNDVPQALRKLVPASAPAQDLGNDGSGNRPQPQQELVFGQYQSLLLAGNSEKALEKIVVHLTGGSLPALGDTAAFQANQLALFRDAPIYGWVNARAFVDLLSKAAAQKQEDADASNPLGLDPGKIMAALGLSSLKTAAFSVHQSPEGALAEFFVGVPESTRQGIFKILAGESKDWNPPPFVPADAVKFQRWRLDGQKTWATLEKTLGDISPQWLSGINFLLDTANTAARDKDPGFDIRKNLIGNLGDDIITYEKAPQGGSIRELSSPPSIVLIGSPQPEQLASALKSILVYLSQQAGAPPQEREFLGRKIYSVPLRPMGLPGNSGAAAGPVTLSYAASGGYLALSTSPSLLEEYLRSSGSQGRSWRETPGLADAAQKVTGPGTSLFGYQNEVEILRGLFDALRKSGGGDASGAKPDPGLLQASLGLPGSDAALKGWFDFSLLPSFDRISKYFYLDVYGGSATTEGLMLKIFKPESPALKAEGTH